MSVHHKRVRVRVYIYMYTWMYIYIIYIYWVLYTQMLIYIFIFIFSLIYVHRCWYSMYGCVLKPPGLDDALCSFRWKQAESSGHSSKGVLQWFAESSYSLFCKQVRGPSRYGQGATQLPRRWHKSAWEKHRWLLPELARCICIACTTA